MAGDFKIAFAMKAALGAGDFGAAAKVLWAFLKLEWARGTAYLQDKWLELKGNLGEIWDVDLFYGLKAAWIDVVAFMRKAWVELQRAMLTITAPTQNWIAQKFTGLFAWMYGVKAEDAEKHFDEDQARTEAPSSAANSSTIKSPRSTRIETRRPVRTTASATRRLTAVFSRTRPRPGLEQERAKTKAEAEAEEGLAKASKGLAAAAKAAEESTKKTHPTLKKASDAADEPR